MADVNSSNTHTTKLELAIESNDSNAVEKAIHDGDDVNKQNCNGNSALHSAISRDSNIDILRCLVQHGANLRLTNGNNHNPLESLNHGSLQTALNLLKLEKHFDFRDEHGKTLLHMFMDRLGDNLWGIIRPEGMEGNIGHKEQDELIELFWRGILDENEDIKVDLNIQDNHGNTPLHIAAGFWPSSNHLKVILTQLKHFDPFVVDCNGDTFLHVYLSTYSSRDDTDFNVRFLRGELQYCPKSTLQKLLNCQNNINDSPLHVYLKETSNNVNKDDLNIIVEAGADVNLTNDAGETALFCVIRHFDGLNDEYLGNTCNEDKPHLREEERKCARYLVENGAKINIRNKRGVAPIFLSSRCETVSTLVDMGAELDILNTFGQTPLLAYICNSGMDINVIHTLLNKGSDVNAIDENGNSVLHYIAWTGISLDIIAVLEKYGVKSCPDKIRQLPCQVAYRYGTKEVFDKLCHCKIHANKDCGHFKFQREFIEYLELHKTKSEIIDAISNRFQMFRGNCIVGVLKLPGFGHVVFEDEAHMIKLAVNEIVSNVCKEITEREDLLSSTLMQSGSVGECTKTRMPNEFDFVCIFDKLTEFCTIDEDKSAGDPGFVYLKLKQEFYHSKCRQLFDGEGYLDTFVVRSKFQDILEDVLQKPDIFNHPSISFDRDHFKGANCPTFHFAINWIGCLYKNMKIDIDLVPACRIKDWWPVNANLNSLECDIQRVKENGALLMLQTELFWGHSALLEPISKLRISAIQAEKEHMKALPTIAREAYIVSKVLLDGRICPGIHVDEDVDVEVGEFIKSYMIKTCMFHVYHAFKDNYIQQGCQSETREQYNDKLYQFVLQIFQTLLEYSRTKVMPSYIFPWQNVFTFTLDVTESDTHLACVNRSAFAKLVLNILGQEQDFKDIDTSVWCVSPAHSLTDDEDVSSY